MPIDLLADDSGPRDLLSDYHEPMNQQSEHPYLSALRDYAVGQSLGIGQGLGDIGASIGNIPAQGIEHFTGNRPYNIPHPSLQQYYPQSVAGQIGSGVGEFASGAALPFGGAVRGARMAGNPLLKMLMGAFGGGTSEAATHEGDRLMSGIEGATAGALPGFGSLATSATSKNIANKLLRDKDAMKQLYGDKYSNLFKQAESKGIKDVDIPDIDLDTIAGSGMPKYHKSLHKFIDNPSLENAHWAQSELGGLERNLDKVANQSGLTPTQAQAYHEAVKAKDSIKKSMFSGDEHLSNLYDLISHGYKDNVVPWKTVKGLEDFRRGELTASDLTKQLMNNKKFKAQLLNQYPSLKLNSLSRNPYLQSGLAGLIGAEAGHKIYKAFE